jgi:NDP-mannose synthase
MKAIILAGGKGTRLAPYSNIFPKPLTPIGEMPILEVLLRQMKIAGIDEVILTVGHMAELLRIFFRDGNQWGLDIQYSYEETPLGTAGPLALVKGLDNPFLVTNSDILTTLNFRDFMRFHNEKGVAATIAVHNRQVNVDFGLVQWDENHFISGYTEKPVFEYMVSMGIYMFHPRVLDYIPCNQYLDFPDLIRKLISAKELVIGFPFNGYWKDLGQPDDYKQAVEDFEKRRDQFLPKE